MHMTMGSFWLYANFKAANYIQWENYYNYKCSSANVLHLDTQFIV